MGSLTFEKIMRISEFIMDFVILNVMWFLGTLLGLGILGWAPSTAALLSILRDKIMKKEDADYNVAKEFCKIYKKEFKRTNIIGISIMSLFIIVSINQMNFEIQPEYIFKILTLMSMIAKVIIFGMVLYTFPLYVHYNLSIKECMNKGLLLIFGRPFVTICIVLWTTLVHVIISFIPGLIAIFGVSVYAYGIMAINYQFFMRNEQRLRYANQK